MSRSMTRQAKPARIHSVRKMSTMAIRLRVKCRPSRARIRPAVHPSRTERVIRVANRTRMSTENTPARAEATRQPSGLTAVPKGIRPHNWSPRAIIHLPTGGWTMKSPPPVKMFGSPWASRESEFSTVSCS